MSLSDAEGHGAGMGVEGKRCLVGQNCKQALRIHPQAAGPAKGGWPSTWSSFSCQTVLTTWGPGHSLTVLTLHPHPSKPGALCSPLLPVPGQIPRPKPRRPVWGQQEKRGWEDNCGERAMVVQAARGRGDPGRPEARGSPPQPGRPLGPLAETGRTKGDGGHQDGEETKELPAECGREDPEQPGRPAQSICR